MKKEPTPTVSVRLSKEAMRQLEALQKAWGEEPLLRLRTYLLKQKYWSEEEEEQLTTRCDASIAAAVDEYLSLPKPVFTDLFDYHYEKLPADLNEQRIEAEALFILDEIHKE